MKKLLTLIFILSISTFGQDAVIRLLLMGGNGITYNGTELTTNAINRDMEVGSDIISNGSFGGNITGWIGSNATAFWYNTDWNAVGRTNCLLDSATVTSNASAVYIYTFTAGARYKHTFTYYIPSVNTSVAKILPKLIGGGNLNLTLRAGTDSWTTASESFTAVEAYASLRYYMSLTNGSLTPITVGDKIYIDDISIKQVPNYTSNGNHSIDSSSTYKQAGTYSGKIVASAAGNGTTNTISLASTLFTAVTNGTNYRFQVYAYTSTANTTLTFKLGDIVLTNIVPTTGMNVLNFDFVATASTTGNIYLYLDKAATVYVDNISLKSGS